MEPEAAKQVLQDMVANNSIDGKVVEILINNYDEINESVKMPNKKQLSSIKIP